MFSFLLFLIILIVSLAGIFFCVAFCFAAGSLVITIVDAATYALLRNKVKNNPRIGVGDGQGNLVLKQGRYTVTYKLSGPEGAKNRVTFISLKRRILWYEKKRDDLRRRARNFWLYREWIFFFEPRLFFSLLLIILLLYVAVFEPDSSRTLRFRWTVSGLLGLPIRSVSLEPGGWVAVSAQRYPRQQGTPELLTYHVNPFRWLALSDAGYIVRDTGTKGGSVTYPVKVDSTGTVAVKKREGWATGTFSKEGVTWVMPTEAGSAGRTATMHYQRDSKDGIVVQDK